MSGKVHLLAIGATNLGAGLWMRWSRCGRRVVARERDGYGMPDEDRARLLGDGAFSLHAAERQCAYCREKIDPDARRQALSVAIFCGAIAGALDPAIRAVIADYIAHGDPSPLIDLAEQRGLHEGGYGPERYEEWAERDAHGEGDNPHVWLPAPWVRAFDATRFRRGRSELGREPRRCPCGVFEHEARDEEGPLLGIGPGAFRVGDIVTIHDTMQQHRAVITRETSEGLFVRRLPDI